MVDSQPSTGFDLQADLNLERFDHGTCVQQVAISTDSDGTLRVSSTGQLPRIGLRQLAQARKNSRLVAETIGQNVIVEHDGERVATLRTQSTGAGKWSIRWWSVFRQWLGGKSD